MDLFRKAKTWTLRIVSLGLLSFFTITVAVFNPGVIYANKTQIGNYRVLHQGELSTAIETRIKSIDKIVDKSEFYDSQLSIDLCLDDGSPYTRIFTTLMSPAFGRGFSNKVVIFGDADFDKNHVTLNGYRWNLEQLFAHEITHVLQFNRLGLWGSQPIANHPEWKWEGYAEYVSRKSPDQRDLHQNIRRLEQQITENPNEWGVFFTDGTVAPRFYYRYWLLVQYCLDIKGMTYTELLESAITAQKAQSEMDIWYEQQREVD